MNNNIINPTNLTKTNIPNTNTNLNTNHHRISNGTQACAACKYQRRKCAPDCVLAPYFPHDRQRQFLNAHKLFGVSNITKIIRNLSPQDKDIAMHTIMFQSDVRAKDPVGGCYRIIRDLHHQIEYCKVELDLVFQQLAICKAQAYQQQHNQLMSINHQVVVPPLPHQAFQGVAEEGNIGDNGHNNNNGSNDVNNNDDDNEENYRHYHEMLMRCHYEDGDQGGVQYVGDHESDQFSWTPQDDVVLASSNSSNSHGECFIVKHDLASGCDGLPMKLMRLDSSEPAPYGVSDHVDITCGVIPSDGIKFGSHPTTPLSEEITLKENKIMVGN
ncbi:hypothetical protein RND81_04G144100 [Saponaria officinalis]|uniref:LOB domain-containing protein n=1 Tax=Saponaria officinalis TaxID=3572 RepID=A0AAW1LM06_SAPOF